MKKTVLTLLIVACSCVFALAQTYNPLAPNKYPTSANDANFGLIVPIPDKITCSVAESSADKVKICFSADGYFRDYTTFERFEGNIFAETKGSGDWIYPPKSFLIMQPDQVMELYATDGNAANPELKRVIAVAPKGSKLADLKKVAKERADAFKFKEMFAAVEKRIADDKQKAVDAENARRAKIAKEAEEQKIAAENARKEREAKAAAEKAAREKAAADRAAGLANADFCTPLNKYLTMVPSRFKALKGKVLPQDELYDKGDTTFASKEVIKFFDKGTVQTRHKSYDNATDLNFYMVLSSEAEMDEYAKLVAARINACYVGKSGWTCRDIMGSQSYVSSKGMISLTKIKNTWDEGVDKYQIRLLITTK